MRRGHWILDGKELKPVDLLTWARWFETADRTVRRTSIGDKQVSTVFLGIDHRFGGDGPPLLFETMVFPEGEECRRYATYDEAVAGHGRAVREVRRAGGLVS